MLAIEVHYYIIFFVWIYTTFACFEQALYFNANAAVCFVYGNSFASQFVKISNICELMHIYCMIQ